jgi:hypothetical protein
VPDLDEPVGIAAGQRFQRYCMDDAEDAVLAPMPRAMMRMATEVKPGLLSRCRMANFRSCRNLDTTRPSRDFQSEQLDDRLATQQNSSIQTILQTSGTKGVRSRDWVSASGQTGCGVSELATGKGPKSGSFDFAQDDGSFLSEVF